MDRMGKFLRFIKENPPPCFYGEGLYFLNSQTGEIARDEENPIVKIAVDNEGKWTVAYQDDPDTLFELNIDPMDCTSYEQVKKFRDQKNVKYALYIPSSEVHFEHNGQGYNYLKVKELSSVKEMKEDDTYIKAIVRQNHIIESGMIVQVIPEEGGYDDTFFLITENGYEEISDFKAVDSVGENCLENLSK